MDDYKPQMWSNRNHQDDQNHLDVADPEIPNNDFESPKDISKQDENMH